MQRLQSTKRPIIRDSYPVRHIHDYSDHLFDFSIFSKIDLVTAYSKTHFQPPDI
jgi:hypothetical protein